MRYRGSVDVYGAAGCTPRIFRGIADDYLEMARREDDEAELREERWS